MVYSGDVLAEKLHKKRRNKVMVIALGELLLWVSCFIVSDNV